MKDLKALRGTPAYVRIRKLAFEDVERWTDLTKVPGLKRLHGHNNAYRIRIGDYRIGFLFDGQTITFARALHRKDIYRFFP